MKVKVISLPYIFQVLYVLCFTKPRYQVTVYRNTGPLVAISVTMFVCVCVCMKTYFSVKDFSGTTLLRIFKFGTKLGNENSSNLKP